LEIATAATIVAAAAAVTIAAADIDDLRFVG
jgi:hypothetical protein